ncbi:MAG: NAD-dependent epimerase/dehydratase family protein [Rhodobacteraceae bacterium]|nr:NAD-dependent epimerase/dehydratase family protein [Paracoccaceae bacterium]
MGRVLVVGGTGRLGTLLRAAWAVEGLPGLVWQRRSGEGEGPRFDPLGDPAAYARAAAGARAILNLAGRVGGGEEDLARHADLARAALQAGAAAGVGRVFLASSAAVYGGAVSAAESRPPAPVSDYGRAKLAMELAARAHRDGPAITCLRIGNVAGADQLLAPRDGEGPQTLHVLADGGGLVRSYIGPRALARVLAALFAASGAGHALPEVLNVAQPGAVRMDALLRAAGRPWRGVPAPDAALPEVTLNTGALEAVIGPLPRADAGAIVADLGRLAGARP